MNCEQFQEVLHDLARDEGLGFAIVQEALDHVEQCSECDALLDEADALTTRLRALGQRYAAHQAPARLEVALLGALRERHATAPRRSRRVVWAFAGFGGAVAAALIAVVLLHDQKPAPRGAVAESSVIGSVSERSDSALVASEEPALSLTADPTVDFTNGWPVAYEGETAQGSFVALSDGFDPAALDTNSVVRVSMTRAALTRLGVYLDGDGPVVADLVVSGDGTPQAIRVVQW